MAALALLRWWYSEGFVALITRIKHFISDLMLSFSVPILITTLFSPWRQVVAAGSQSIGESIRGAVDNTVSRFVGFGVRSVTLIAVCIILVFSTVAGVTLLILWPFLPLLAVALIIYGLVQ